MNPSVATAPTQQNLVRDIMPPSAKPAAAQAIPVVKPATQAVPSAQPQPAARPVQASMAPATAQSPKVSQPAAHQSREQAPVLAITLAILIAGALVAAAWLAFYEA